MLQILKYLHVNNGVKMLGNRSKHKAHLYFIYTIYIKFKGRTIFLTHLHFNHEQTRKVRSEVFHVTSLCQGSTQELCNVAAFQEK